MNKLIQMYLNRHYYIKGTNFLNLKTDNHTTSFIVYTHLSEVFGLSKKQVKWYIKDWVKKQNRGFNFNTWWGPPKYGFYFPFVKKVVARTLGVDLAVVQPMSAPSGYIYAPYIPVNLTPQLGELNHVPPNEEIVSRYATREVNPNFYGEVVNQFVGVSSRLIEPNQEIIRRWRESGLLEGLTGSARENIAELFQSQLRQVIN